MKKSQFVAGLLAIAMLAGAPVVSASSLNGPEKGAKKSVAKETVYTVDTEKSELTWTGKKVTGEHHGPVKVEKGNLTLNGTQLTGGAVSVDLRTITSTDLKDNKEYHDKLVNHLKSEDFFSVDKHPTAIFKITKVTPKSAGLYDVTGDLTIKGITKPVSFPVTVKASGNALEASGKATIDRAKYDMKFRSKSFFDNLGDKMIDDEFTLDMKIVANAGGAATATKTK